MTKRELFDLIRENRDVSFEAYKFTAARCADLEARVAELERLVGSMRRDEIRACDEARTAFWRGAATFAPPITFKDPR